MPREVAATDEFRGARFTRVDLSNATMRDVDLTRARIIDATLVDAELSGLISGLRVNGVEVAPLIEAELDRQHPERLALRASDPRGLGDGWALVEEMWRPTIELARTLPEEVRQRRVDGEWSLTETLRHLIFVTDGWFRRAVLGESQPYHPLGLAPTFLDGAALGLDIDAAPSFDAVLAIRQQRVDLVRRFLATVTADVLEQPRPGTVGAGYPPATDHRVLDCIHVVMDEEWNHHQYATRDLAVLMA